MNHKKVGIKERQRKKKSRDKYVYTATMQILDDFFPSDISTEPGFNLFDIWTKIENELQFKFTNMREYRRSFNYAVRFVENYRKKYGLNESIPSYLITLKSEKQTKNRKWQHAAWAFELQYNQWFNDFIASPPNDLEIDKHFQALVLSFICHSGHCCERLIYEFVHTLGNDMKIYSVAGSAFVTLRFLHKDWDTNAQDASGDCMTQQQCYLSPLTLGLLSKWRSLNKASWPLPYTLHLIYESLILGFDQSSHLFPQSLKKIAQVSVHIVERLPGIAINQALSEYISGRTKSYSLPENNLARIETHLISDCEISAHQHLNTATKQRVSVQREVYSNSDCDLYYLLKDALKRPSKKEKLSSRQLKISLNKITTTRMSNAQKVLLHWLIHKLNSTCKPKTISNYHSILTRRWIYAFEGHDIMQLSHNELTEIYRSMIEKVSSKKNQQSLAARISDLHAFCVAAFGFPALVASINDKGDIPKHVRAGFVDETLFKGLLAHIDAQFDITDDDKNTLKCIAIISYRCGLRISELVKIKLKHIEKSSIAWMQIRTSIIEDNKSAAALRKVPLLPLLMPDECQLVKDVLSRKRIISKSSNNLAFTLGTDPNSPFNRLYVSSFISSTLRALSQIDVFVFHSLRHSCLSRFHLMMEIKDVNELLPNIVPFDTEQCEEIIQIVCGASRRNRYYNLADFDGHESPKTCFNSYFHFTDWIVCNKLSQTSMAIGPKENSAFHLLSRDKFNTLQKQHARPITPIDCLPFLIKKLGIKPLLPSLKHPIELQAIEKKTTQAKRTSLMLSYDILTKYEAGYSIDLLALEFNIDIKIIKKWVDSAKNIQTLKTTRMNPSSRHSSPSSLLPGKPTSEKELALLNKFISKIRIEYPKNREDMKNMLEHALSHQCTNQSGITFQWPEDLECFLRTFENVVPKNHWRIVTYTMETGALVDEWEIACKNINTRIGKKAKLNGAIGKGYVRLELKHPNEKSIKAKQKISHAKKQEELNSLPRPPAKKNRRKKITKYSSNALSFLLFMMAIRM